MNERQLAVLKTCPLFADIEATDIPTMLDCLAAGARRFAKNEAVFRAGEAVTHIGVVLAGQVRIEQDDYWGNRTILTQLGPGELFGEAFSCAGLARVPVSAYAVEEAVILMADYRRIITNCPSACVFHTRLIQNMLRILAQKNVALTRKMETITQRTTRDKLLAYLSQQAKQLGQNRFDIPFNRQELADYLSVDRSAMSAELSKMRREGLLRYDKNHFELA